MITLTGIGCLGIPALVLIGGYTGIKLWRMWRYRREVQRRLEMWTLNRRLQQVLENE